MPEIINSTYEIIDKIGSGGAGTVYLAKHLRLNKKVVLKADKRKITTKPELLRREVDVLKNLSHMYIPQVYDFFADDETVYTVMDYIDGESLDKPLKRGEKFTQPQVIKWAIQILEALRYLHSPIHGNPPHGYIHSDIKPANIMCRPNGEVCLIDFNIALALGETTIVGTSAGYASPEHYGLDFSFSSNAANDDSTILMGHDNATQTLPNAHSTSSGKKTIIPDTRSDIYSLGATLYHLLSGVKPAKRASEVVALSKNDFSPQIVDIISKAMNPNPDLRYQSAEEMLYAFEHLRDNDVRTKRYKRIRNITTAILLFILLGGISMTFVGLKQLERLQNAYALAEYSSSALQRGDVELAIAYALEALPESRGILDPPYTAQAQYALTNALGVYDLTDGYKEQRTITLESEPLKVALSPNGTSIAAMTLGRVTVYDTSSGRQIVQLEAEPSALSDIVFRDDDTIIYAGENGICAYSLNAGGLWTGGPATSIALSADASTVAAVYKDESFASIYDADSGSLLQTVDFEGRKQSVVVNDVFADPENNLFAISANAEWLAVSFSDGSMWVYNLNDRDSDVEIYEPSDFVHFEGGFCGEQFAFVSTSVGYSLFAVVDMDALEQMGSFSGASPYHTYADETGIYVTSENVLVKLDPTTGEQTEVAYIDSPIAAFEIASPYTIVADENGAYSFFDSSASLLESHSFTDSCDFLAVAGDYAVVGSMNSPNIVVLKLESYDKNQLFSYDATYSHDEARLSADGQTIMLFSYDTFRIYSLEGNIIAEVSIPDSEQVYDQQYRRNGSESYLDVVYNDGTTLRYSATTGELIERSSGDAPDGSLYEEFYTDKLKITSPLHGTPIAYDIDSGKMVRELESDAYLTYVTQVGEYVVTEYITVQGERYGLLLNEDCETLAKLPNLCDVLEDGTLIFDDMRGNLRETHIYSIQELFGIAKES